MKLMAKAMVMVMVLGMVLGAANSAMAGTPAADVYKAKCAMCHGADGSGNTAMGKKYNLKSLGSPEVQKQSDAQLTEIITKGKDKMPAYDGKLSADEIKGLVAFIRTLK